MTTTTTPSAATLLQDGSIATVAPTPMPAPAPEVPNWGWEATYVTLVVIAAFSLMLTDIVAPDFALLGGLALVLTAGIIDVPTGLKGFSNEGLLTVAVLFAVAAGINNTGALDYYMQKLLGQPRSIARAQFRLMAPVALISAFLNNTPVVAILIPIVQQWARRIRVPASQLFIPLSFGKTAALEHCVLLYI